MSTLLGQDPAASGQGTTPAAGAGTGNQDWRSALPDDLKSEKVFESIKGKDWSEAGPILAKNYLHAQKMVGAEKLVVPHEKATPEEWAAFYTKLGRPAKPEEYSFKLPDGLTEDKLDKGRLDLWRKEMFEAGIPKNAADRLISRFLAEEHGSVQAQLKAQQQSLQQGELTLRSEFGPKFDEKLNYARAALRQFGSEELTAMLDSTGLGSNPEVVKFFAKIGEGMKDDIARGAGGRSFESSLSSPETAQMELNEFNRDDRMQKALFDKNDPQHDFAVERRTRLFRAAFPKEEKD